jgi:hypothetical protein
MTTLAAAPSWLLALAALIAGFAMGLFHFGTLRRNADAFVQGRTGHALALQLLRLLIMGMFLVAAVRLGALVLLSAALGVFAGRYAVLAAATPGERP